MLQMSYDDPYSVIDLVLNSVISGKQKDMRRYSHAGGEEFAIAFYSLICAKICMARRFLFEFCNRIFDNNGYQ